MPPTTPSLLVKRPALGISLLGLTFGFLHASLFRELSLKIPINFFFPHFLILAFTGMAAGLLHGDKASRYLRGRPYLLLLFLAVFLLGIWVYRGDSIFFWTLAMYYPMPIPEYGWLKAVFFLAALVMLPLLFFLLASPLAEVLRAGGRAGGRFCFFFLGMAAGTLLGYPAQFLGPEVMFVIGALALLVAFLPRPSYWLLGLLVSALVLGYGHWKRSYPILLSLKDYKLLESRTTDNYKIDFYSFRDGSCVAQAINDFMHVYTCRDHENLPVELSFLNKTLSEGLEDYRVLIVGCSIGMYPYQLLRANPSLEKCVIVDVDRQLADTVKRTQEAIGLDLYKDPRFQVEASEPRYFLEHARGKFDLIYLHRIGNALVFYPYGLAPIEYYLLTRDSQRHLFDDLLEDDGVYIMDWGIPEEQEVRQFVVGLPEDVFYRTYWTTVSNNPLSGAPLIFVLASRNQERLDQVSRRLEQATYFHEVRKHKWPEGYRPTDDKPWVKNDVVTILTCLLVPFVIPLLILFRKSGDLEAPAPWRPGGAGRRYYLLFGVLLALFNAYALGRATRQFPLGVNPGWLLVEATLLVGLAVGARRFLLGFLPGGPRAPFLLISIGVGAAVYLLDTLKSFPLALLTAFLAAFLLGQAFTSGLAGRPPRERVFLYGFQQMGFAFGIAFFQVSVFLLGFRVTGLLAAALLLAAGWLFAGKISAAARPEAGTVSGS